MLQSLHIQNYAIIDQIAIDFSGKLNIITGETGAGKSILMGALSLILGERADSSMLLNTGKKCFIEGLFTPQNKQQVFAYLESIGLDKDEELVLRREIAPTGKSRAFINDTPVTLQQLKGLASLLVDLHRQFDTLELSDVDFQREVLDALANQLDILVQYKKQFLQWQKSSNELKSLQQQKSEFHKELGYNQFLFEELNELALKENELEDIEQELKLLSNAEYIKNTLSSISSLLNEGNQPIVQSVKQMANRLSGIQEYHVSLASLTERLLSTQVELKDITEEIEKVNNEIHFDQERIEGMNERMAAGYKLLKKHDVRTTAELLQIQNELQQKLQAVLNTNDAIIIKETETEQLYQNALRQATLLSQGRQHQVNSLEQKVDKLLAQVGMPNAQIKVVVQETNLHITGKDNIEFLFDANKSGRFEAIRKVASGGELSRLMLCIKSLVARSIDLPTMIFDEIDTGISGEAAKQVGLIMKELSASRQLICITHQPQIAGKADAHFFVYKDAKENIVKTNIRQLTQNERITAIAQMLSGETPTIAAMENAKEMVTG